MSEAYKARGVREFMMFKDLLLVSTLWALQIAIEMPSFFSNFQMKR